MGHLFALLHRGPASQTVGRSDGIERRWHSNVMVAVNMFFDVDIVQTKALWKSPIVDRCLREQHPDVHATLANQS
jgi:hypothetical protein